MSQNLKDIGHIALLSGGGTAEREISIRSGDFVESVLKKAGAHYTRIDPDDHFIQTLQSGQFDLVFSTLHGGVGENGTHQALFSLLNLPCVSPNVKCCALAMDKIRTKWLWSQLGLPTAPACRVGKDDIQAFIDQQGLPIAIKPNLDGSSIGIHKVEKHDELEAAIKDASQYGEVIAEKWITGDEYTVSILGEQILPSIKVITQDNQLVNYERKYSPDTTRKCPSGLSDENEARCQTLARKAFEAIEGSVFGRIDMIHDIEADIFYLLEANTLPGLTANSFFPIAARTAGYSDEEMLEALCHAALITV